MPSEYVGELKKWAGEFARKNVAREFSGLSRAVDLISKNFALQQHEVAIFIMTPDELFLRFIVPEKLQEVGRIPMTSMNSLAVRTARDRRPEIINHFSAVPHPSVFEAVQLVEGGRGDPIQKIMSAPVAFHKKVIGVIQVSRKGQTAAGAGPDFKDSELRELKTIADALAPCISLTMAE
jgi:signal transduction protein with GAF and PtsI domain